ncbi:YcaO-like family protein [Mycobacterium decipiens]|uniref:YcaO domain-containing protein n=1 Tax=Mycobacterium decipiens TaxID=1430326 RepID=A0A1X2LSR0_9MYCO|nr:YcaO-like family protein [Mycobacterium decipiens]OSC39854.1 hypothetical protein B8W66_15230 [Mycobacterium decipiens]
MTNATTTRRVTGHLIDSFVVHIETDGADVVISPLLGDGRLCERCWRRRRAAAIDRQRLTAAEAEANLAAALDQPVTDSQWSTSQRSEVNRHLAARTVDAQRGRAEIPYQLARIASDGYVRVEPVVPLPECPTCWHAAVEPPKLRAPQNIVGETAGIVTTIKELPPAEGELPMPHVMIVRLANSSLNPDRPIWTGASGKGWSKPDAIRSGLGEAVERYCASVVSVPVVTACHAELPTAVDPAYLSGMSSAAAAAAGQDPTAPRPWVAARVIDGAQEHVWVPAASVYLNLPPRWRTPRSAPMSSNGLACGVDEASAITSAFREVIERHEFFSVWYGLSSACEVVADNALAPELQDPFAAHELRLRVLILGERDGVVVASASCWPRSPSPSRPGFTLGLGAGDDAAKAMTNAVLELAQVYRGLSWALQLPSMIGRARSLAAGRIVPVEPYDHGLLYSQRDASTVPWPFGLGARRACRTVGTVSSVTDFGQALFVDLTSKDVLESVGWRVVRVLVPDAIPFHFGTRTIPDARLYLSTAQRIDFAGPLLHPLA